jgi:hypothetical protein
MNGKTTTLDEKLALQELNASVESYYDGIE